ncbi:hypothetical protein ACFLKB_06110 [Clostridium sp. FAM 1755]|uniref:hypothetical protein n=1 Tax=Clostridium caseinilyticum TaxID=3350403 RepID=UPI0038F6908A
MKMNVTFQNDKSLGKAQAGLSREKADVNMEKYNKIETGIDMIKEMLSFKCLFCILNITDFTCGLKELIAMSRKNIPPLLK